jgi:hypothetical protein
MFYSFIPIYREDLEPVWHSTLNFWKCLNVLYKVLTVSVLYLLQVSELRAAIGPLTGRLEQFAVFNVT